MGKEVEAYRSALGRCGRDFADQAVYASVTVIYKLICILAKFHWEILLDT